MAPHMRVVLVVRPRGRRWWWICDQRRGRTPVLNRYYNTVFACFWGNFNGFWLWIVGGGDGGEHLFEPRRGRENGNCNTFIREGPRRQAKNCNVNIFIHEGPRRTATSTPLSAEGCGDTRRTATSTSFSTEGHGGSRRRATSTPLSTEGREELQLQHLCPRRAAEGQGEGNGGDVGDGVGWVPGQAQGLPLSVVLVVMGLRCATSGFRCCRVRRRRRCRDGRCR